LKRNKEFRYSNKYKRPFVNLFKIIISSIPNLLVASLDVVTDFFFTNSRNISPITLCLETTGLSSIIVFDIISCLGLEMGGFSSAEENKENN